MSRRKFLQNLFRQSFESFPGVQRFANLWCAFWFFLHNAKSTKNVPFRRKLRGFANLESAHRSHSSTPQQLKPFKEESRFFKPQISALKQQIRTNQLNPFETIQGLSYFETAYSSKHFPLKIPIFQTASKPVKNPIQAPKAAKKRIKRPKRRKESPKKLKKGEKRG